MIGKLNATGDNMYKMYMYVKYFAHTSQVFVPNKPRHNTIIWGIKPVILSLTALVTFV